MHDDNDWDSELADTLLDIVLLSDDGSPSAWKISLILTLVGLGLLLWHLLS